MARPDLCRHSAVRALSSHNSMAREELNTRIPLSSKALASLRSLSQKRTKSHSRFSFLPTGKNSSSERTSKSTFCSVKAAERKSYSCPNLAFFRKLLTTSNPFIFSLLLNANGLAQSILAPPTRTILNFRIPGRSDLPNQFLFDNNAGLFRSHSPVLTNPRFHTENTRFRVPSLFLEK